MTQALTRRDAALLAQMPPVAVPPESPLAPLDRNGQRMLLAKDGLFLEVRRDWLYTIRSCGHYKPGLQTPYGHVEETTALAGEAIPRALVRQFIAHARQASPNEIGAIITYNLTTRAWRLRMNRSVSASTGHLDYAIEPMPATEHRIVDIHSHGQGPAFISATDAVDSRGATAVVMVVGRVSEHRPVIRAYLYLQGMPIELGYVWSEENTSEDDGQPEQCGYGSAQIAFD